MFNFFKKKQTNKCCSNTVSKAIVLGKYKKEATECMVYIREVLQPAIQASEELVNDTKAKSVRKEIAEKIEKALIPFYTTLENTINNMMKFSFKYDLGYLEPNLKEYYDAEERGRIGIINPSRMYQSLDVLHQMYSKVNTPGALKADIKVKLNRAYYETRVINQILAALVVNIETKQRESKSRCVNENK